MGKKQQRKKHRKATTQAPAPPAQRARAPAADTPPPAAVESRRDKAAPAPLRPRTTASWTEFRERYRYVNVELKRIGVIAASFLVVLLILTAILG